MIDPYSGVRIRVVPAELQGRHFIEIRAGTQILHTTDPHDTEVEAAVAAKAWLDAYIRDAQGYTAGKHATT